MTGALFVGLCTLDVIQLVDHVPAPDEKLTARRQTVSAGGPAANAAVACAHLGTAATLVTGLGGHPLAAAARADLTAAGVRIVDLAPAATEPPPVSSVLVSAGTGQRAVASTNAVGRDLAAPADLATLVAAADIVELDGHHPGPAGAAVRLAAAAGRRTILDGGSWKPGTADLLPHVEVAVCSAAFRPPGTRGPDDTLRLLRRYGVRWAALTDGPAPIRWQGPDDAGTLPVPAAEVVDTLGAGDVLHGALTHALAGTGTLTTARFTAALRLAAATAARSCATFGTRAWLTADGQDQSRR